MLFRLFVGAHFCYRMLDLVLCERFQAMLCDVFRMVFRFTDVISVRFVETFVQYTNGTVGSFQNCHTKNVTSKVAIDLVSTSTQISL